ncbi:MAG: auxin-responsive protein [Clostridiaceae bacterium BRH_c20a]|nr:MAG: auxin-responsive protein [Clostridiaceae bacterium BRH_c20a]
MGLDQKLREKQYDKIWQEYCGFLDLSMPQYMDIQNRLMLEQIELYSNCELGRRIMKGQKPTTVNEYRKVVPLTKYEDYADILLPKVESALPGKPMVWIETTWEGGKNPVKVAPYTEGMINCLKTYCVTIIILASSNKKGEIVLSGGENFLYGMAPLPYLTGLVPHLISSSMSVNFLPTIEEAESMSFKQRNKVGFELGIQKGIDLFFGLSSIIVKMGDSFAAGSSSGKDFSVLKNSPKMNYRLLKAWIKRKEDNNPILPKDIWKLKGLVCSGTDSATLKKKMEYYWGVKPLEIFGGTEPTCIATETWNKNGLVLFPDICFYEFIPKSEMEKNLEDPLYVPKTYLLNELLTGIEYELVISNFKGGAFARYRTGDMFKCLSLNDEEDNIQLPQFVYVDRDPRFIDIAGFTRISEVTICQAIELSKLDVTEWFAVKEFDGLKRSLLHLYVEVGSEGIRGPMTKDIIKEHLSIYFRYVDTDFSNLKSLLGIDPLKVTIIPTGTISQFYTAFGRRLRKMNPSHFDLIEVLKIAQGGNEVF